jgi:hypothetical protein
MKTVNSLSGGKSSSYIAANYPADYNVFSLVRTNYKGCIYPDKKIRQIVSDKIGADFIGTLEQDNIIKIMLDLEQFIGSEIKWLTGVTFEDLIKAKKNYLPNLMTRFCTTELKLKVIFNWWQDTINEPVDMRIGFRANEQDRADRLNTQKDENGLISFKTIIGKSKNGKRNKWGEVKWRTVSYPLINDMVFRDKIHNYWLDKPVGFEKGYYNNCVGCFHRSPIFLSKMAQEHKNKMEFFAYLEDYTGNRFRKDVNYKHIINWRPQMELKWDDFDSCDSGLCGL